MNVVAAPRAQAAPGVIRLVAGDGLLHPVVLAAIATLVLNDHVLKAAWPGLITGKISDFAGLLFFPLFLQAAWEVASLGRARLGDLRVGLVAVAATGIVFAAIKTLPPVADTYSVGLGWLQWLVGALAAAVSGGAMGVPHQVAVAVDPTDLIALPMLLVAYMLMQRRGAGVET